MKIGHIRTVPPKTFFKKKNVLRGVENINFIVLYREIQERR